MSPSLLESVKEIIRQRIVKSWRNYQPPGGARDAHSKLAGDGNEAGYRLSASRNDDLITCHRHLFQELGEPLACLVSRNLHPHILRAPPHRVD